MAYAHGITREDVFAVATEIFATGKNPTQASVRAKLGRGSFSTISKYLAEWRETQTDAEAILDSDQEMTDETRSLLKRLYSLIRVQAEMALINEQVTLLEGENERLRERVADYDAVVAELEGLRFAYKDAMERLERLAAKKPATTRKVASDSLEATEVTQKPASKRGRGKAKPPEEVADQTDSQLGWETRVDAAVGGM